ncbi:MAG: FAD binding domain-containing protein [Gemmatimonadetes bacterium]|nr:FAD binding domain-containing protein [Gemmatimonadota bacterium]
MSVLLPTSRWQALELLAASQSRAVPMNGGTDLLVHWPVRLDEHERTYVDLSKLDDLRPLAWTERELVLGGLTTYWDVIQDRRVREEFPLLVSAARQVGAIQIQARGTWAGNIVNASPAADGVPALMAYDAVVVLESVAGREETRLDQLYLGYKALRRRPDQLVVAIRIPRRSHSFQAFEKVGSRRAQAITKVGLAIARSEQGWRVVANSMAPTVRRCRAVEQMLDDRVPVTSPEGFYAAIDRDVSPIDDIRSTAEYRKRVMARLLYYDLRGVCEWIS